MGGILFLIPLKKEEFVFLFPWTRLLSIFMQVRQSWILRLIPIHLIVENKQRYDAVQPDDNPIIIKYTFK